MALSHQYLTKHNSQLYGLQKYLADQQQWIQDIALSEKYYSYPNVMLHPLSSYSILYQIHVATYHIQMYPKDSTTISV